MQNMSPAGDDCERLLFCGLYKVVVGEECDPDEFAADDLYAFSVTERALRTQSEELRNLAAHLQARRHASLEAITLPAPESLDRTWRLPVLRPAAAVMPQTPAAVPGRSADAAALERRGKMERFTPDEIIGLSKLQRLYRRQFKRPLDIARFAASDSYGRQILAEAMESADPELMAAAKCFLDAQGQPHHHRRNT